MKFNISKILNISRLFSWEAINKENMDYVNNVSCRHDIPKGSNVPEDLRDIKGTWQLTKDGYPVAGQLLPEDTGIGSMSPATPLYLGMFAVVAALAGFLPEVGLRFLVLPMIALYALGFIAFFSLRFTLLVAGLTVAATLILPYLERYLQTAKAFITITGGGI
ncbi:hypothetical protein [Diaphorobacter aerolatus]|uniref:Uncharacterized protein n=1 Tax=Diaphorobacter aerolatus TaxID=1288495 RepID=A0A7H0GJA4_9BURK|nr:hypothetical protein [Diaphorobacter aerolatus]QNP48370.1 hypothetical protein H9K75_20845 [Diaphorobacter aerolatus]